jgi:hypothetical protein
VDANLPPPRRPDVPAPPEATDIAGDIPGIQNVWVQSVGCGTALVHFGA